MQPTLTTRAQTLARRYLRAALRARRDPLHASAARANVRRLVRSLRRLARRAAREQFARGLRIAYLLAQCTLAGQRAAYRAHANPPARPSPRRDPFARLLARHTQGGR